MPRNDYDQVVGPDGSIISEVAVVRPVRVVSDEQFRIAKQQVRSMIAAYFPGGVPTGEPTLPEVRNWLIALSVALRYVAGELDDETEE